MEFYLPSLFLILLAAIFAVGVVPRFTPVVLAILASIMLALAVYNHMSIFRDEYRNITWANIASVSGLSPYLMTGSVIVLCIGYIVLLFSSGKTNSLNMPSMSIPPPSTATNVVTQGIGQGLVNAGMANVNRNYRAATPPANTAGQQALNSALAKAA